MTSPRLGAGRLLGISDLHVAYPENRDITERLAPEHPDDWLIVAGDVGELYGDIEWALGTLSERFARVIWAPGNHELWTHPTDPVRLRGEARYRQLVELCRRLGVLTPEDDYAVWSGVGGPVTIAPLFLLYDYTFRPEGTSTTVEALERAYEVGVVCTDEMLLHPDPYPSRDAWSRARVQFTEHRLEERTDQLPTVLVNHFPLVRDETRILRHPEFALWCGTTATADWHRRFHATAVVYGHLHIPRTTWHDDVRFEEVSVGYPRERKAFPRSAQTPRVILPAPLGREH